MGRCDLGTSKQPHELSPFPHGSQSPEPPGLLEGVAGTSQPAWGPAGVLGTVSGGWGAAHPGGRTTQGTNRVAAQRGLSGFLRPTEEGGPELHPKQFSCRSYSCGALGSGPPAKTKRSWTAGLSQCAGTQRPACHRDSTHSLRCLGDGYQLPNIRDMSRSRCRRPRGAEPDTPTTTSSQKCPSPPHPRRGRSSGVVRCAEMKADRERGRTASGTSVLPNTGRPRLFLQM